MAQRASNDPSNLTDNVDWGKMHMDPTTRDPTTPHLGGMAALAADTVFITPLALCRSRRE